GLDSAGGRCIEGAAQGSCPPIADENKHRNGGHAQAEALRQINQGPAYVFGLWHGCSLVARTGRIRVIRHIWRVWKNSRSRREARVGARRARRAAFALRLLSMRCGGTVAPASPDGVAL